MFTQTTGTAFSTQDSRIAPHEETGTASEAVLAATGSYDTGGVAAVQAMYDHNGRAAGDRNDPSTWTFATWSNDSILRIIALFLYGLRLAGEPVTSDPCTSSNFGYDTATKSAMLAALQNAGKTFERWLVDSSVNLANGTAATDATVSFTLDEDIVTGPWFACRVAEQPGTYGGSGDAVVRVAASHDFYVKTTLNGVDARVVSAAGSTLVTFRARTANGSDLLSLRLRRGRKRRLGRGGSQENQRQLFDRDPGGQKHTEPRRKRRYRERRTLPRGAPGASRARRASACRASRACPRAGSRARRGAPTSCANDEPDYGRVGPVAKAHAKACALLCACDRNRCATSCSVAVAFGANPVESQSQPNTSALQNVFAVSRTEDEPLGVR